jgi:hypothetical protein
MSASFKCKNAIVTMCDVYINAMFVTEQCAGTRAVDRNLLIAAARSHVAEGTTRADRENDS